MYITNIENLTDESTSLITMPFLKKIPNTLLDALFIKSKQKNIKFNTYSTCVDTNNIAVEDIDAISNFLYLNSKYITSHTHKVSIKINQNNMYKLFQNFIEKLEKVNKSLVGFDSLMYMDHMDDLNQLMAYLKKLTNTYAPINSRVNGNEILKFTQNQQHVLTNKRHNNKIYNQFNFMYNYVKCSSYCMDNISGSELNLRNKMYFTEKYLYYCDTVDIQFLQYYRVQKNKDFIIYLAILDVLNCLCQCLADNVSKKIGYIHSYDSDTCVLNNTIKLMNVHHTYVISLLNDLSELMNICKVSIDLDTLKRTFVLKANNAIIKID